VGTLVKLALDAGALRHLPQHVCFYQAPAAALVKGEQLRKTVSQHCSKQPVIRKMIGLREKLLASMMCTGAPLYARSHVEELLPGLANEFDMCLYYDINRKDVNSELVFCFAPALDYSALHAVLSVYSSVEFIETHVSWLDIGTGNAKVCRVGRNWHTPQGLVFSCLFSALVAYTEALNDDVQTDVQVVFPDCLRTD
jgi:hypothetical protein